MAQKRKGLFSRIFGNNAEESDTIQEVVTSKGTGNNDEIITSVSATEIKPLKGTDVNNTDEDKMIQLYRQMENDSIISAALDLYADNATQVNAKTGHVASVECADAEIAKELNDFLWNIVNIDTEAWQIVRDIARDGKILLDTRVSDKEWSFVPIQDPSKVSALTVGQNEIKYYVVAPDEQRQDESNDMFSVMYSKEQQHIENYKVEDKDRFIAGFNSREIVGKMTIAVTNAFGTVKKEELLVRTGKSSLANIVQTYQVLASMEDSLFLNRLTKSVEFKVVQIDVSDSNNKQATKIVESVKNAIKSSETIDMMSDRYQNRQSPIPYNDFIYIPVKGTRGSVTIEKVGGEVGEQKMADIEYFRNKLFAGLAVLKAYLGFEETTPGGLGDATLTMLDERFGRRVVRYQQVLKSVIEQIVSFYWRYSSNKRTRENMPKFKIIMGKISTKEEEEKRNRLDRSLDTAGKIVSLAKDDLFINKVDPDKLFNYIFNDVVGIDVSNFDNTPMPEDISVRVHKLGEDIKTISEQKVKPTKEYKQLSALFEEFDIYIDINGKEIPFNELHKLRRYNSRMFTEKTYAQLKDMSKSQDPQRLKKSKKLVVKYTGINDENQVTFRVTAEDPDKNKKSGKPTSYKTKVALKDLAYLIKATVEDDEQMSEKDLVMMAIKDGDLGVSCNCPAAKYWGQQFKGTKQDYSIDKNDIPPETNVPLQPVCKHTLATLTVLPFWYNTIVRDLRQSDILPSSMTDEKKAKLTGKEQQEEEQEED